MLRRLQLNYLLQHHRRTPLLALFSFVNGLVSIASMTLVALVMRAPFVFPSLGPTAFLFFATPLASVASPRNTVLGHLVGAAAGWSMLALFHLADNGSALVTGVTWERAVAAGLSLGLTSAVMLLLRAPHPPAGATTLIVSLGIMTQLWQMGVLMLAVALLTAQAVLMNRLAGIPYPLWRAPESPPGAAGPPHS